MNYRSNYIKNLLLPCLAFSVTTGIFSALLIALFKWAASRIIGLSGQIYAFVRTDPRFFPLLIVAFALLGLIVSFILSYSHSCRGGGIPTSIAAIRGHTSFHWIKSALLLPVSALSTFLCGIPLGNEGPSVQMGAAIGRGTVRLIGSKKDAGWNRYIMTGGAAAGFAAATGAPITAILFSMEEVHRRFSPLLFSVASISVIVSQLISRVLAGFGIGTLGLFHISNLPSLPLESCFIPIAVGLACGICAVFFTRGYNGFDKLIREKLGKVSLRIKLPVIFALTAIIGFFSAEMLGSGHDLVELIFERSFTWYLLVLFFLVRAIMLMVSNTV
ncbi:MAG: chloride channel protein, partial [Clostridia bacterium]|nr:chloride channel protein [Clostridia bacterium]